MTPGASCNAYMSHDSVTTDQQYFQYQHINRPATAACWHAHAPVNYTTR